MKRSFYWLLVVACSACNKPVPDNHKKLEQLADKTCRAIDYRKQRFSLANQIRFAEDTLMQTKSKIDSDRLNKRLAVLAKEKETVLEKSLSLSDSIRMQLDSLIPYTNKDAQKRFTGELNRLLAQKGCNDESKQESR
jgi:hypothetical protein